MERSSWGHWAAPLVLSLAAATALILTVKHKRLQMTGAKPITRK